MNPIRSIALLATSWCALMAAPVSAATAAITPFAVRWTAPGDDSLTGRATVYDLRYSTFPLTAENFHLATRLTGVAAPAAAGTPESFVISVLPDGVLYYIAIKSADEAGNWSSISNIATRLGQVAGVDPTVLAPSFSSPWPNPARQSVRWAYALPRTAWVQVDVFDAQGRHVKSVTAGESAAGRGEFSWDLNDDRGRPVGAGLYFAKARLGQAEWTKRLVVVR